MLRRISAYISMSVFVMSLLLVSCGGGGGGGAAVGGGGSGAEKPSTEVEVIDGAGNTGTLIIKTEEDESGNNVLTVNGENLQSDLYSNTETIKITDENGNSIDPVVDENGNISIVPVDGDVAGTYTVIINVTVGDQEREYYIVVTVDADGAAEVMTAVSYPAGSAMVLDLSQGKVYVNADLNGDGSDDGFLVISSPNGTSYVIDPSVISIVVRNSGGVVIGDQMVDGLTGDIIIGNINKSDSYSITLVKQDGNTVTRYIISTDSNGKVLSISVEGVNHVLIPVVNGTAVIVPPVTIEGVLIQALIPVATGSAGSWQTQGGITITAFVGEEGNETALNGVGIDTLSGSIITSDLVFTESKVVISEITADSKINHTILLDENGNVISYIKVEIKNDGTQITTIILLDENGNVTVYTETVINPNGETTTTTITVVDGVSTITVENYGIMMRLNSGVAAANGFVIPIASKPENGTWARKDGVQIVSDSIYAANGHIQIDSSKVTIDPVTGYLLIYGDGTLVQKGPYEIKVVTGDYSYIIKSDVNGNITAIIPGNILLQTSDGFMSFEGRDIVRLAGYSTGGWDYLDSITGLRAVDSNGSSINISIDSESGNLITDRFISGQTTLTFLYTDAAGNGITYTVIVINGSVYSYTAEITDPSENFDFSTVTNIKVFLNVVDANTGSPIKQASISLVNSSSANSWVGYTDDNGRSIFTATVEAASQTTSLEVTRNGYISVNSPITGIGKLIEIGKKIAMTPEEIVIPPVDSDGDGVYDSEDDYPYDNTGAKKISDAFTFAFEDQYTYDKVNFNSLKNDGMPTGNDADFNDLVIRLSIEKKIDSQNKVREIKLNALKLAALSGANNSFGIYVNGVRYIMIKDAKNDANLDNQNSIIIPFNEGIDRDALGPMPFDPFMVPNGGNKGTDGPSEVHLASVYTTYTGVRKGNGWIKTSATTCAYVEGFVWAVMLPENWQWPNEGTCIAIAYTGFINWCNTDGAQDKFWYNSPVENTVAPR